jgi:DNA-directed RNA polymerase sigma subunit (sigma70/sigma32)
LRKYNHGVLNVLHLLPSEVRERVNRERVEGFMESLTEKERAALELRFGMNGGELRSFKRMGDELGMTHTGAMKLFRRAMKKLLVHTSELG